MKIVFAVVVCFVGLLILAYLVYRYLKRKPVKPLKKGDYVMFRSKYKTQFPLVPTSHALVIEEIVDNRDAIVVFMTTTQILKETVPLYTLLRAS